MSMLLGGVISNRLSLGGGGGAGGIRATFDVVFGVNVAFGIFLPSALIGLPSLHGGTFPVSVSRHGGSGSSAGAGDTFGTGSSAGAGGVFGASFAIQGSLDLCMWKVLTFLCRKHIRSRQMFWIASFRACSAALSCFFSDSPASAAFFLASASACATSAFHSG